MQRYKKILYQNFLLKQRKKKLKARNKKLKQRNNFTKQGFENLL